MQPWTAEQLRTFLAWSANCSVNHALWRVLGYASVTVTLTIYAHVMPGDQRQAAARLRG